MEAAINENGKCPLMKVFEKFNKGDKAKAFAFIHKLAEYGANSSECSTICKHIEGKLWELRPPQGAAAQVRVFYYVHDIKTYVALWAVKKKQDEHKPSDIEKARELMERYKEIRPSLDFSKYQ